MNKPTESATEEKPAKTGTSDAGAGADGSNEPPKGDQEGAKWPGGGKKGEDE